MPKHKPRPESLAPLVHLVRGERVLLDSDLAALYGVEARALNQAVARNRRRFPTDFMFRLAAQEFQTIRSRSVTESGRSSPDSFETVTSSPESGRLRSQFVISKGRGGRRYRPYAFTEQGIAMLSSVLRSPRAVEANIAIMRTFVQLRRLMDSNRGLARKIEEMEKRYDEQFVVVFDAIKRLITEDEARKARPGRRIGFISGD
jgi:hypothetical protein